MTSGSYYRAAPGVEVVPLEHGHVLLRSDALSVRLEGASASFFANSVFPLLNGRRRSSELASQIGTIEPTELEEYLGRLADAHVLLRSDSPLGPPNGEDNIFAPLTAMVEALGIPGASAARRLRDLKVAVFGLEGPGAHVASMLIGSGIGNLMLVDPYPCSAANLTFLPPVEADSVGRPRDQVLKTLLEGMQSGAVITIPLANGPITRENVEHIAANSNFLVGCFDKGFSATNQWINRASLTHQVPSIHGELRGHKAVVGPLVLPGESACYMCWRMRSLSCEDEFTDAIGYEEYLDRQREPRLHWRPSLPPLASFIGSLIALEVLKTVLALSVPALAARVREFDALTLESKTHTVLQRPDCPVCKKKGPIEPDHPPLDDLTRTQENQTSGDVAVAASDLISAQCGIIRSFRQVTKDPGEPVEPYIYRAELANHRFLYHRDEHSITASGKGLTPSAARMSALGEAVERYSASMWNNENVLYARRSEIKERTLDPRRLVLYATDQYRELPYQPYSDDVVLGWVRARSLLTDESVMVPALAAFMAYDVQLPEEYLFPITSNGLAAGSTLVEAVLNAALEVIERDAFIIMWLNRLPCLRFDPLSHPDVGVVSLVRAYTRRGVAIELFQIPSDHPVHVFIALGVQVNRNDGPAVVVGLGSSLDSSTAARAAILEVAQVRPALRIRMRSAETRRRIDELVADPHLVTSLDDHELLYADARMVRSFDFIRDASTSLWEQEPEIAMTPGEQLRTLANYLGNVKSDIIYRNLTTLDMAKYGIHTVRCILPDFQPIHFGRGERRLGGTRLFELPQRLRFRSEPSTVTELNDEPHPLA